MASRDDASSWQKAMAMLRLASSEAAAATRAVVSMPLGLVEPDARFDPTAPHRTPVVMVHGLLGAPTNFRSLRRVLAQRGVRNVACFSYAPRVDYQRLAPRLAERIDAVCRVTGAPQVDVVGHSLGGLVARYLVETGHGRLVRRLVTLGTPYVGHPHPAQELAVFAAGDLLVPAPPDDGRVARRMLVVRDCGHLGLLYHPAAMRAVVAYLTRPALVARISAAA